MKVPRTLVALAVPRIPRGPDPCHWRAANRCMLWHLVGLLNHRTTFANAPIPLRLSVDKPAGDQHQVCDMFALPHLPPRDVWLNFTRAVSPLMASRTSGQHLRFDPSLSPLAVQIRNHPPRTRLKTLPTIALGRMLKVPVQIQARLAMQMSRQRTPFSLRS